MHRTTPASYRWLLLGCCFWLFPITSWAQLRPDTARCKRDLLTHTLTCDKSRYKQCLQVSKGGKRLLLVHDYGGGYSAKSASMRFRIWQRGPKSQLVHKFLIKFEYTKQKGKWKLAYIEQRKHSALPLPKLFPTLAKRLKQNLKPEKTNKLRKTIELIGFHQSPKSLPLLLPLLRKTPKRLKETLSKAIARIGEKAMPALRKEWAHKPSYVLHLTFRALGEKAIALLPSLRKSLTSQTKAKPLHRALRTIRALGPKAKVALPQIKALMKHTSSPVKSEAVKAICTLATSPKEWRPALALAAKYRRLYSLEFCLRKIGPTPQCKAWIQKNYATISSDNQRRNALLQLVEWIAAYGYGLMASPKEAREALQLFLKESQQPKAKRKISDSDIGRMVSTIVTSYQQVKHPKPLSLPVLRLLAFHHFKKMSHSYKTPDSGFFRKYHIPLKRGIALLRAGLLHEDVSIASGALKLTEALQTHATPLLPTIAKLLHQKKKALSNHQYSDTFKLLGAASVPLLGKLLLDTKLPKDAHNLVRNSLAAFGPQAALALPQLKKALRHKDPSVVAAAIKVLNRMDFWRFGAAKELHTISHNPKHPQRAQAALLLQGQRRQKTTPSKASNTKTPAKAKTAKGKKTQTKQAPTSQPKGMTLEEAKLVISQARRNKQMPLVQQERLYHSSQKLRKELKLSIQRTFAWLKNPSRKWLKRFAGQLKEAKGKYEFDRVLSALAGRREHTKWRRPRLPAKALLGPLKQLLTLKGKRAKALEDIVDEALDLVAQLGPKAAPLAAFLPAHFQASSWSAKYSAKLAACQLGAEMFPAIRKMLKAKDVKNNEIAAEIVQCMKQKAAPLTADLLQALLMVQARYQKQRNYTNGSCLSAVKKAIRALGQTQVQKILKDFNEMKPSLQEAMLDVIHVLPPATRKKLLLAALRAGSLQRNNDAFAPAMFKLCRQPKGPTLTMPFFQQGLTQPHFDLLSAVHFCISKLPKGTSVSAELLPFFKIWQKGPEQLKQLSIVSSQLKRMHRYYQELQAMVVASMLRIDDPKVHKQALAFAKTFKSWKQKRTLYSVLLKMTHRPALIDKWLLDQAKASTMKRYSSYWAYRLSDFGKKSWVLLPKTIKLLLEKGPGWSFYGRRGAARAMLKIGFPKDFAMSQLLPLYSTSDDELLEVVAPYLWNQKGLKDKRLFKRLDKEFDRGNFYNRSRRIAAKLLAKLKSPEGLSRLLVLLQDGDATIEKAALRGLEALKPLPSRAIPALVKALSWRPKYKWRQKSYKIRTLKLLAGTDTKSALGTKGLLYGLFFKKPKQVQYTLSALSKRKSHHRLYSPLVKIICTYGPNAYHKQACALAKAPQ